MRKLLNVLYITTEDAYATLDGDNVAVKIRDSVAARFPLHILEGIYIFSYAGASPRLIGRCVEDHIDLVFCTPNGRFLARPVGRMQGNVLLRKEQYRISDSEERSCAISCNMIIGKLMNERHVLDRMVRDHPDRINVTEFQDASERIRRDLDKAGEQKNRDSLRGIEGEAASTYFYQFDDMILRHKDAFYYHERSRRPPMDRVNALLSYAYMMLTSMCESALETVGLDPYVGFMHTDRPGRASLALDLIEEFRPCLADRFVLGLINNGVVGTDDFEIQENGSVLISSEARKKIQQSWQQKKQEQVTHPYLKEKIPWGLVPYTQAMLLARCIRGDIDGYPPFIWR